MRMLTVSLVAAVLLWGVGASSQESQELKGPQMNANLVEPEKNAAKGTATVVVDVSGVALTDPAMAKEVPMAGQAHLHYQVDDGPVVATPTPKLSFHGLKPGDHVVVVTLAANDHSPLGPKATLNVRVPTSASAGH
jgi:hypothetical protein